MNILHVKSITLASCVSVVVSGDFCCFKLALPSLLFQSKDWISLISLGRVKILDPDWSKCITWYKYGLVIG